LLSVGAQRLFVYLPSFDPVERAKSIHFLT
jgi:hypothetical protein